MENNPLKKKNAIFPAKLFVWMQVHKGDVDFYYRNLIKAFFIFSPTWGTNKENVMRRIRRVNRDEIV